MPFSFGSFKLKGMGRSFVFMVALWLAVVVLVWLVGRFSPPGLSRLSTDNFSYRVTAQRLWVDTKKRFVQSDGRTTDPERENITTSEGQSYTLLMSVWQDDRATFDLAWGWTRANLQHTNDHLFAWLYGQRPDGTSGVLLEQNGQNSASDADTDIALALLMASRRWGNSGYETDAKNILADIWQKEVGEAGGVRYLAANDGEWSKGSGDILLNPSYCAPYAYRIFAQIDSQRDWGSLLPGCQKIMGPLGKNILPSDWVGLNAQTGQLAPASGPGSVQYGYDALRIPFRLALSYQWQKDQQDLQTLKSLGVLKTVYSQSGRLYPVFKLNGAASSTEENLAVYGGNLGYFFIADPKLAGKIVRTKILTEYNPDSPGWRRQVGYYEAYWGLFGLMQYSGQLTNFFPPPVRN